MNGSLIADLRRIAGQSAVTMSEADEHVQLRISRAHFSISVVVPKSVLEFSIDVCDLEGGLLVHDWLDYAGYDATPEPQLAEEMRVEVATLVERLTVRNLRLVRGGRNSLEWQTGDRWLQAIPFVPDVERALPADARKTSRG
jgi:hypothetical protein